MVENQIRSEFSRAHRNDSRYNFDSYLLDIWISNALTIAN